MSKKSKNKKKKNIKLKIIKAALYVAECSSMIVFNEIIKEIIQKLIDHFLH